MGRCEPEFSRELGAVSLWGSGPSYGEGGALGSVAPSGAGKVAVATVPRVNALCTSSSISRAFA